jgi:hypothetical protein
MYALLWHFMVHAELELVPVSINGYQGTKEVSHYCSSPLGGQWGVFEGMWVFDVV